MYDPDRGTTADLTDAAAFLEEFALGPPEIERYHREDPPRWHETRMLLRDIARRLRPGGSDRGFREADAQFLEIQALRLAKTEPSSAPDGRKESLAAFAAATLLNRTAELIRRRLEPGPITA